ncbi:MAG: sugar ABC transporter permease [Planctomycetota bacterium]|nr:MAG: sugar ABC transporter permease [Planctomycetota bacterium]
MIRTAKPGPQPTSVNISSPTRRRGKELLTVLPFIAPWLLGFLTLVVYPFVASLVWSFDRYDMLSPPEYVGTANYERLADELVTGQRFGQAVWNTAYFALLSVPLSIVLGVGLAVMLSWQVRGQAVYRTILFLPSVVPIVASSILWLWLLDPQAGLVNYLLSLVGLPTPGWFNSTAEAAWPPGWFSGQWGFGSKDALVLMSLWGVGNFMIIYLAAIGDIPLSLYEAAELDGAGPLRRFWHVTLPMLSPVIFFNLVMGLIHAIQAFTQVYIVSEGQGAPAGSTLMLSLYVFLSAFKYLQMGYASAIAWTMFLLVVAATWALFRTSRRWVYYQTGRGIGVRG